MRGDIDKSEGGFAAKRVLNTLKPNSVDKSHIPDEIKHNLIEQKRFSEHRAVI